MIERAVTAGVPFAWVAADEVYGDNGPLRAWLEDPASVTCWRSRVITGYPPGPGGTLRAITLAARLPKQGLAAAVRRRRRQRPPVPRLGLDHHRRSPPGAPLAADPPHPRTGELAFYRCYAPHRFRWPPW